MQTTFYVFIVLSLIAVFSGNPQGILMAGVFCAPVALLILFCGGVKTQLAKPRRVKEKRYRPGRVRYVSAEARLKRRIARIRRSLMADDMKDEMIRRARDDYERDVESGL